MTRKEDVATVRIVFSRQPGGPPITMHDLVSWAEAKLAGPDPDGFNSLRYSDARVVEAAVLPKHDQR